MQLFINPLEAASVKMLSVVPQQQRHFFLIGIMDNVLKKFQNLTVLHRFQRFIKSQQAKFAHDNRDAFSRKDLVGTVKSLNQILPSRVIKYCSAQVHTEGI